jgi:ribonuclease BN (tRNA processing enzyme)
MINGPRTMQGHVFLIYQGGMTGRFLNLSGKQEPRQSSRCARARALRNSCVCVCACVLTAQKWDLIVLGCGASSAVPKLSHLLQNNECLCQTTDAHPENRRGNPSILLRKQDGSKNILIDCGKTFREQVMRHFKQFQISHLDSVLITHQHFDAVGGLDDLREVQKDGKTLKIFMDDETTRVLVNEFPYLFSSLDLTRKAEDNLDESNEAPKTLLYVATLENYIATHFVPFRIDNLEIIAIPLYHGNCPCVGFLIKQIDADFQIAYFSDFRGKPSNANSNDIKLSADDFNNLTMFVDPQRTLPLLKRCRISHCFLDALHQDRTYFSHSNAEESVAFAAALLETHSVVIDHFWFTGMSCSLEFNSFNQVLAAMYPAVPIRCSRDGMVLSF